MMRRSGEIDGIQLLTSSVAIWVNNVLTFSLLYWQIRLRSLRIVYTGEPFKPSTSMMVAI